MASDYLLEIEGIKGESEDSHHPGTIEIQSFSWGLSNSGSTAAGGERKPGRTTVTDFTFTKAEDTTSPLIFGSCAAGDIMAKATIYLRAGARGGEYLKIELNDVLVTSFTQSGGGDRPTEQISLNYARITYSHNQLDSKGGAAGDPITKSFDVKILKAG